MSPCKDCSERCYKCHSTCKKYQEYSLKRQKFCEQKRADDLRAYYYEKYARIKKR